MSDIFISYKSEDRPRARVFAARLEAHGFSVWWDRQIPPGKTFDQVIQEALDRASCIIVLWSESSVKSNWVKEEAEKGASRGILVPVLIDDVPIPLGFGRIQTANLVAWQGDASDPRFAQLTRTIEVMLGATVESSRIFQGLGSEATIARIPPPQPEVNAGSRRRLRVGVRSALWAAAVLLSASTGAGVYSYVSRAVSEPAGPAAPGPAPAATIAGAQAGAAASEPYAVAGPMPSPAELREGGQPGPAAADAAAVTERHPVGEPSAEGDHPPEAAAGPTPLAVDPAAEAYKQLAELQQHALNATLNDAGLLAGYEELWSRHRQWLEADAAARVLGTIASLKASIEALETLQALEQRDELTILDRLARWRELEAATSPDLAAGRRAAERIEELEEIVRSSATITAEDRFVTCERVPKHNSRPIGVREDFRPGMVYAFAWVNAPRSEETLTLKWLDGDGRVTRTQSVPVSRNTAGGYRIFYAKQHSAAGRYEVRLYNQGGQLIGRRPFTILY